jgi:ribonucleoside-diphosphate reductase alpha chain
MEEQGFPCEADVFNPEVKVFAFPVKAPAGARVEGDLTALESLELWATYQEHWCEHKPSITVHYQDREVLDIGAWVYRNFDKVSGVSFLPKEDHVYQQAPYEAVSEDRYRDLLGQMPNGVVWDQFVERYDNTSGSQELACSGGVCEVVDLT